MKRNEYLNRGLSTKTLLICDLWESGMDYSEIAESINQPIQRVYNAINRAKRYGKSLRPRQAKGVRGFANRYNKKFGVLRYAIHNLPPKVSEWLFKNTPDGMTVAEYIASFVLDAYNEEVGQ